MGLFGTRWEAEFDGHSLVVSRNELTKGFKLEWDGVEIAHRTWSWLGLGELHASAAAMRGNVEVRVAIQMSGLDGKCVITIDGAEIPVRQVK